MRSIWRGAVSFGLVSIAVKLYSAEAASLEPFGDPHVFVGHLPQFGGRHDMRDRPAVGIRLIRNPFGGGHRTPELLAAGVPPQLAAVSNLIALMPATTLAAFADRSQLPLAGREA